MKNVTFKNYVICFVISITSIALALLMVDLFNDNYKSVLTATMKEIKYEEFNNYVLENSDFIIYLGNKSNERFENNLYEFLKDKNIDILYMYVNDDNIKKLSKDYSVSMNIPNIVIFSNGLVKDMLNYNKNIYDISDVEKFLNKNGVLE